MNALTHKQLMVMVSKIIKSTQKIGGCRDCEYNLAADIAEAQKTVKEYADRITGFSIDYHLQEEEGEPGTVEVKIEFDGQEAIEIYSCHI